MFAVEMSLCLSDMQKEQETDMRTDSLTATKLEDYSPSDFAIDTVDLEFDLHPTKTRVRSRLKMRRVHGTDTPLILDGDQLTLLGVAIDGKALKAAEYQVSESQLSLPSVPNEFELVIETQINPAKNAALMGLYVSNGRFCTQCEAQGFRRITYYLDRPDVMSVFTVKITADKQTYPVLLSNGNQTDAGDVKGGRHFAVWHDPFAKPCYLFALVAGSFDRVSDQFTTMRGRVIPLDIFVDQGDAARAHYAMDALKRAMLWDEQAFGREYDLDRFMIVAVRDFNFGAMENKGLNIFNSSLLLADEASATDFNFELIESVVAHEYFHNWTGNRITCRDWFQLCLKEGFTVFRDQEFSADARGAANQRIKDVKALRARQFAEDAGPLAHPVRPTQYVKIDNFYTATVYEKGAELVRMLKTMLGAQVFRKGCDVYFETLDGTAATVEQFIACFEQVSGRDLSGFMRWYEQAGTPNVTVTKDWDAHSGILNLRFEQKTAPTPGQAEKRALPIPVKMAVIDSDGQTTHERDFVLEDETMDMSFENVRSKPALSLFQNFSAPITLQMSEPVDETVLRMRHDPDLFNRWEAGQTLGLELLCAFSQALETGHQFEDVEKARAYLLAMGGIMADTDIEAGYKALAMRIPDGNAVLLARTRSGDTVDPLAIFHACNWLKRAIGETHEDRLLALYDEMSQTVPFKPDAAGAGRRALGNTVLGLLAHNSRTTWRQLARTQFDQATNMTEEYAALQIIAHKGGKAALSALSNFYDKWQKHALVIDKWFSASATLPGESGFAHAKSMIKHKDYGTTPNRVRALLGGFAHGNPENFHRLDGQGYAFMADEIINTDKSNPMVAARLAGVFEVWSKFDAVRAELIRAQLTRILDSKPSANLAEIATKSLGD